MKKLLIISLLFFTSLSFGQQWKENKIPSQQELKKTLTPLQFSVSQNADTEYPFKNEYWDNKKEGIYVDIVSGEPLFSSTDKFDSETGWPSFTKPMIKENLVEKEDRELFVSRTEVRSKHANSHLGHVFDDGPQPSGKRYCMNSASMRFIPKDKMKESGYEELINVAFPTKIEKRIQTKKIK